MINSDLSLSIVLLFIFWKWSCLSILTFDRFDMVGGTFGGYNSPAKLML